MSAKVMRQLFYSLAGVLRTEVEPLFKPGMRCTLIVRDPNNDEADVIVTDDDYDELVKLLDRSRGRENV